MSLIWSMNESKSSTFSPAFSSTIFSSTTAALTFFFIVFAGAAFRFFPGLNSLLLSPSEGGKLC